MPLVQSDLYTEEDYYNLPEDIRAELINSHIYYQTAPDRAHQTMLSELHAYIHSYLKTKKTIPAASALLLLL